MAKKWLPETDMPIKDISSKLRYNNSQNFIRSFRKQEGITPGQYRDKQKEGVPLALEETAAKHKQPPEPPSISLVVSEAFASFVKTGEASWLSVLLLRKPLDWTTAVFSAARLFHRKERN